MPLNAASWRRSMSSARIRSPATALIPAALPRHFVVVQDMFLTETAMLADVVLPTSNLYEKSGTVTNTYGDLQLVKKAADRAGVRSRLRVDRAPRRHAWARIANKLVPFGSGVRADMGQTRGAQSGEADRHGVWLAAQQSGAEAQPLRSLRHSRRDPAPGSGLRGSIAWSCWPGTSQHVAADGAGLVQIVAGRRATATGLLPANDTLFTSGTLGRYSEKLNCSRSVSSEPSMAVQTDPKVEIC